METRKIQVDALEDALFQESWDTPVPEIGPEWKDRVMAAVEQEAVPRDNAVSPVEYSSDIWRFSLAASLLAVVLGCYLYYAGVLPEYDLAALFLNDPAGFFTSQPIGV